ncbi:MAG TPA: TIGR00159 family protein, partial [Firmicutes bacterium]|nr:TIGR00159 family protein [Candidatus Fermentithermobacillaceae bacterium]
MLRVLSSFTWKDYGRAIVDIAIVAYLFYQVFVLIRGTRAVQLLKGIGILFVLLQVTDYLELYTVNWLLGTVSEMLIIAIPVVFSAEIRRALEQIGRGRLFTRSLFLGPDATPEQVVEAVTDA